MATVYYPGFQTMRIDADGVRVVVTSATISVYNVTASSSLGTIASDSAGNVAAGSFTATAGDIIEFSHATYPLTARMKLTATQDEAYRESSNILSYVLEDLSSAVDSTQAIIYAEDVSNPTVAPWVIGQGLAGTDVKIPIQFNVAKNLRLFPISVSGDSRTSDRDPTNYQNITIPSTDSIISLADDAWEGVRRNSADTAFEAYDTRASRPLFDQLRDYTTQTTSAETAFLYSIPADVMLVNGDRIEFRFVITTDASASNMYARLKFGGTTIFDSGTSIDPELGNNEVLILTGSVRRVSKTIARCEVEAAIVSTAGTTATTYTEVTGLNFKAAIDFLCELQTSDTAGDMTLKIAHGTIIPAAPVSLPTDDLWDYWESDSYSQGDGTNISTNWVGKFASKAITWTGTPTFETNELNSLPIIRFPGGSVYGTFPTMAGFTAGTIFLVWKITDVTTDAGCLFGTSGSADEYPDAGATTSIKSDFGSNAQKTATALSAGTITSFHVAKFHSASANFGIDQNAMTIYSTGTNTVGFSSAPRIGHNGTAGMKMDLAGVYVYSNNVSAVNVAEVYRYIGQKFGI